MSFLLLSVFALASVSSCGASTVFEAERNVAVTQGDLSVVATDGVVHFKSSRQVAIRVALVNTEFLDHALASFCFGSPGCGVPIASSASADASLSNAAGYTSGARGYSTIWWDDSNAQVTDLHRIDFTVQPQ